MLFLGWAKRILPAISGSDGFSTGAEVFVIVSRESKFVHFWLLFGRPGKREKKKRGKAKREKKFSSTQI